MKSLTIFISVEHKVDKKRTFEEAMDLDFRCPECGGQLGPYNNSEEIEAIQWKINQLQKEL